MSKSKQLLSLGAFVGLLAAGSHSYGQFTELITSFETDRDGNPTSSIPGSFGDLQVIMFQDPRFPADNTTNAFVLPDGSTIDMVLVPNAEESAVALGGFGTVGGAQGTPKFELIFLSWADGNDASRWARVRTFQSPEFPNTALHLDGKVRIRVRVEDQGFGNSNTALGIGLLIRETGDVVPQGFNGGESGSLEFVGVSAVANANTALPTPAPLPAYSFAGVTSDADNNFVLLEYDLAALEGSGDVIGWTAMGGDGTLSSGAGTNNRGVLEALVLMPTAPGRDLAIGVDEITFEAPFVDPTIEPRLGTPIVANQTTVRVNDVLSSSTNVSLEVDRDSAGEPMFTADETYNQNPGGALFIDAPAGGLAMPLQIGDRVRARQTNPSGTSAYSIIVAVNPPAAFSSTLSIDEDGNGGVAPADFEWVGLSGVTGTAGTQGKPVFPSSGVWQNIEYSLIPGVEPVVSFAGGNGALSPDGGLYNVDSFFFTIDPANPNAGPYEVFVDRIYVIDASDNEIVIGDAEGFNPLPNFRGQSTHIPGTQSSALSPAGSFDGTQSVRFTWTWPDTNGSNTIAPFRPPANFSDTAKAVGLWFYVDVSGAAQPTVNGPIIGNQTMVRLSGLDVTATSVQLYLEGAASGAAVATGGAATVAVPLSGAAIGDSVSATQTVGGDESAFAVPRAVNQAPAPTICGPLIAGAGSVTVQSVSTAEFAVASLVEVVANGTTVIGSAPGGTANVNVTIPGGLTLGHQIAARQTVNGSVSPLSSTLPVTSPAPLPPVVINELQYDDSGVDDREFVELYNAGVSSVDISGWVVRSSDTVGPPGDNNPDYTIPGAPNSGTTVLAAGDFYVIGQAAVPNVDQVIATADLLENDNEVTQVIDGSGAVVDTVVYELNKGPVAVCPTEEGVWGNFQSIDNNAAGTKPPISHGRWLDGFDTDDNGRDFGTLRATPGATNEVADIGSFVETFEGGAPNTDVVNWTASFVNLRYIDPTVVSASNPNAIPASPGGGQAAIAWDPSGGGNMVLQVNEARVNNAFLCLVYIDANNPGYGAGVGGNEFEGWAIGFSAGDALYNFNAPALGNVGANGDTGLTWRYIKFEDADTGNLGGQQLVLIDENNGGSDGTVLFTVSPGLLTTGWHTLTLSHAGGTVEASFDGAMFSGSVAGVGPSSLHIGYREALQGIPATLRPPTIDNLQVSEPAVTAVTLVMANPPTAADNPFEPGLPYRDPLDTGTTSMLTAGIGGAGTVNQGAIQYSPIDVTFSGTPTPALAVGDIAIAVTGGVAPVVTGLSGTGSGPYSITLDRPIPPGHCTTITFTGPAFVANTRVQYRSQPGNVSLDNLTNTQDLLNLVQALNNGAAAANPARYNVNRMVVANTQDLLRLIQLLNGVLTTEPFNQDGVATCP